MITAKRVTGPTFEPVTLAEALGHSRLSGTDPGQVAGYLLAARESLERTTSLAFANQTWDAVIDYGWPCSYDPGLRSNHQRIELPIAPLQQVTSIKYIDTDGTEQTLAADQYRVLRVGIQGKRGIVVPAYGVSWPAVRNQEEAVTVRFVAGFGASPSDTAEPIRQAILLFTAHLNENREVVNVGSIVTVVPMTIANLLSDYVVGGSPDALGGG